MAMVEKAVCVKECVCLEVGACPKVIHGKQDAARCARTVWPAVLATRCILQVETVDPLPHVELDLESRPIQ
jgi:hypothetical protein